MLSPTTLYAAISLLLMLSVWPKAGEAQLFYYPAQAYQDENNLASAFDKVSPGAACDAIAQSLKWNVPPLSYDLIQLQPGLWRCQAFNNSVLFTWRQVVGQCQLIDKGPLVGFRASPTGWHTDVALCTCNVSSIFDGSVQWCDRVSQICTGTSCPDPDKSKGEQCTESKAGCPYGNPIGVALGNKIALEKDIGGIFGLTRRYDGEYFGESRVERGLFGIKWTSDFESRIESTTEPSTYTCYQLFTTNQIVCTANLSGLSTATAIKWRRSDGSRVVFRLVGSTYVAPADVADRLERIEDAGAALIGWRVIVARDDRVELFDTVGRLISVTSRQGTVTRVSYADGAGAVLYHPLSSVTPTSPLGFVAPACSIAHPAISGGGTGNAGTQIPGGTLLCATDHFGRQLHYQYVNPANGQFDSARKVRKTVDPATSQYSYEYDGPSGGCVGGSGGGCNRNNLTKVTYPDSKFRTYFYNEASLINGGTACPNNPSVGTGLGGFPNHLTGIADENGVRFSSWAYDCQGRALSSERAGGVEHFGATYPGSSIGATSSTVVTDPLGSTRTYNFQTIASGPRNSQISGAAGPQYGFASQTFDGNGNVASRTDWNGNRTNYGYDLTRNLETSRTEGLTAAGATTPTTRTVETQWDANFRLPTLTTEKDAGGVVLRTTSMSYDANGNMLTRTITAGANSRTWTHTYNANGSVLTMDGPRTDAPDITTYTYYANDATCPGAAPLGCRGQVETITNALVHVTSITEYNAHGQPLTIVDPNGLTTTLAYDVRQRLTSRNVGSEITSYEYDGVGQLTKVTLPDGSFLSYTYDPAHRLTQISDNLGNRIIYTLDAMGNRTQEQVFDPINALAQTRSRVFSNLNRLGQEVGAAGQTTTYGYDNQGNLTSIDGPLTGTVDVTVNAYDALNRLIRVTDPNAGQVNYGYSALDQLTSVSDPRSLVTSYSYDGLNNLNQQVSPDTGTTVNTYDAAGNLLTLTDAKAQVTTYAYDALNRVTSITYQGGAVHAYQYDQGVNGKGRLTQVSEPNSTTQYVYDQKGRLTSETRTINAVAYVTSYSYDTAGRMTGIIYPSARQVNYTFDALGRIQGITTTKDTTTQTVLSNAAYQPFGPARSFTLGNSQTYARGFDLDGRVSSYTLATQSIAVGFDLSSRITSLAEQGNPTNTNNYGYDSLDRLLSFTGPVGNQSFTYDGVGNRLAKTVGAATDTYSYAPTSNQLAQITGGTNRTYTHDPNGSITADSVNSFAYDTRGRLTQAVSAIGATSYQVNSLGQRIRKTNTQGDTVYHYDAQGRLIVETSPSGAIKKEYIYLGDTPVAVIQ